MYKFSLCKEITINMITNNIYNQFKQFEAGNTNIVFQPKPYAPKSSIPDNAKKKEENKINVLALLGSILGTLIPMLLIMKRQNKNILNIKYEFKEMMYVGVGAILGGLSGGLIKDKKENKDNKWEKIKEANFQFITNLFVPTLFVDKLIELADKKLPKEIYTASNKIAKALAVITGIFTGMKLGEFVTNKINCYGINSNEDKKQEQKRKIKFKDILIHIDDLPIAAALIKEIPFKEYIERFLPICFIYSGYEAGKK